MEFRDARVEYCAVGPEHQEEKVMMRSIGTDHSDCVGALRLHRHASSPR